jgi:hypothetical protein
MAVFCNINNTEYVRVSRVSSVVVHIIPAQPIAAFPGAEMEYFQFLQEYLFL